jgi:hypothetical protein
MAQDIVGSLFGATPQEIQRENTAPIFGRAMQFAQLTPMQQAQFGIYSGGAMLGQGVGGLLGGEDPRLVQARQMQQVKDWIGQSGVDINTPEGLAQAAQYAQSIGATEGAMYLGQQANALKQSQATTMRTEQQAAREQQKFNLEDQLRAELSQLPPDATDDQVLAVVRKYGDPTQIMKALETRATKRASEGIPDEAGPVGKGGAYRDTSGVIRSAGEMKTVNEKFNAAQLLMNEFNKLKLEDVKNAYSPVGVDWTTKGDMTKKLAGSGTVAAQAKIAKLRMEEVIKSLPPGAASDKDIAQALASFPGFGDEQALIEWVNNAKSQLQDILDKHEMDYGSKFKSKYKSSGALVGTQAAQSPQTQQGYQDPEKEKRYQDWKRSQTQ